MKQKLRRLGAALLLLLMLLTALTGCGGSSSDVPVYDEPESAPVEVLPDDPDTPPPESGAEELDPDGVPWLDPDGVYDSKDEVALYLHQYGTLPRNYITKEQAQDLGWSSGSVERYAPGMCIGGNYFGNYEDQLPRAPGRTWLECDINTLGAQKRGPERIIWSNDGLIYYTGDHYESFEQLY